MEKGKSKLIIAVDGYSSTGKSTVAKLIAKKLDIVYIDTGAMYRVITLVALRNNFIVNKEIDELSLRKSIDNINIDFRYNRDLESSEVYLNNKCVENEIRSMHIADNVSSIAALDFVREYLVREQRNMSRGHSVIMDGRDIGSVVFPNADIKFFLTASPDVRAMRRYKEHVQKGDTVSYEEVKENVLKRDYIDSHRENSPLKKCNDAVVIDNGSMSVDQEVEAMLVYIYKVIENKSTL